MEPATDDRLVGRYTGQVSRSERSLFERVVDGGATTGPVRSPPFRDGGYYQFDGGVYALSRDRVERLSGTACHVAVWPVDTPPDDAVRFSDLPAVDQREFGDAGLGDGRPLGIRTSLQYVEEERARSRVASDTPVEYVRWSNGQVARVEVSGIDRIQLERYSYSSERVSSATEYAARLREEFGFVLDGLRPSERKIVRRARSSEDYTVDRASDIPEPMYRLADRFRGHRQVHSLAETESQPDDVSGPYIVSYEGETYHARLYILSTVLEERAGTTTPR